MSHFNVLCRELSVKKSYFLEASAGTGKTFSIENIFVRLLLEGYSLESILVVTFTNAAVQDLKSRLRSNMDKALTFLKNRSDAAPDYLLAIFEKGEEAIWLGKQQLEQALFCFEQAHIFTIHSFCLRMLKEHLFEGDLGLDAFNNQAAKIDMIRVIRDFFRTGTSPEGYSHVQIQIILEDFKQDFEKLELKILDQAVKGLNILRPPTFKEHFNKFKEIMARLQACHSFDQEKLLEDYNYRLYFYNSPGKGSDKKALFFSSLFKKNSWDEKDFETLLSDGLIFIEAFLPSQIDKRKKKKEEPASLHYPDLTRILSSELYPLVKEASSPSSIFASMAHDCQNMIRTFLKEEEKLRFDDYLINMCEAIKNPTFLQRVRQKYKAAIIDEFQDTDPLQWEIFKNIFLDFSHLYLVGDPKQSIYAFRQADIYTYLSAGKALDASNHASLSTNYRSQPSMVKALNLLFSSAPGWLALPKLFPETLQYPPVDSSPDIKDRCFSDGHGSLHFAIAETDKKGKFLEELEEKFFFPYFISEIQRLRRDEGFSFSQFCILVRDHRQTERLVSFFEQWHIPTTVQKKSSLADSPLVLTLKELLKGIISPHDGSLIKIALGGPLIGWNQSDIEELSNVEVLEKITAHFFKYRSLLLQEGFAQFFQYFLNSVWHKDGKTISARLLAQQGGIEYYQDLVQIGNLLSERQSQTYTSPEGLIKFLDEFPILKANEDERIKRRSDPFKDAVQIMTLHACKGLEFDIVFTLGLINRDYPFKDHLIPISKEETIELAALSDQNEGFLYNHLLEMDAEKLRLLYVALTRAKIRLYVPITIAQNNPVEFGKASAMELFLSRLDQKEESPEKIYERINSYNSSNLIDYIERQKQKFDISYSDLNQLSFSIAQEENKNNFLLTPPSSVRIPGSPKFAYSFTSLAKNHGSRSLLSEPPHDPLVQNKTAHTLPSGSTIGIILHAILENVPFRPFKSPSEIVSWVKPFIKGTAFEDWEKTIADILFNVMTVSLKANGEIFSLSDLQEESCYRETEFLHPTIKEQKLGEGFIKGVIDLIFEFKGKYYLLDWKSNWLGASYEDYNEEALKKCMTENDYYLQAELYMQAFKKYLSILVSKPFEQVFGGCFYIFLRGLNTQSSNSEGILFFRPQDKIW